MKRRPRGVSDGWPSGPWNPPSHLAETVRRVVNFQPAVKLTVDDQDFLGRLLLGQSIENRVHGFTEDDTVCGNLLRGTKVRVSEGIRFDIVQYITSNVGFPATLLEVFKSRLDGNNIVGMAGTLDVRKPLSDKKTML